MVRDPTIHCSMDHILQMKMSAKPNHPLARPASPVSTRMGASTALVVVSVCSKERMNFYLSRSDPNEQREHCNCCRLGVFNPLRAKFFRGNINICLHFLPFLHTNETQVVEIPPRVRQGPAYSI